MRWWQRASDEEDAAHILAHNAGRVFSRYALKYRLHALGLKELSICLADIIYKSRTEECNRVLKAMLLMTCGFG
jgi:hypothetical protein